MFFVFLHPKFSSKRRLPPETVFLFVSVVANTLLQSSSFFNSLNNDKSPFFCIFLLHHTTLVCNILIFELLFQLCHNFSVKVFQSDLSRLKKDLDRLNLVLNYISENYKRPISLDEIAGVAYLQTGYFCRFFKKKMGVTFLEYQNEYRLSFIYKDLINTKDPVHVILERHGFTNYKLFRRMFQEHFGCTPTKVRENMRK